MANLDPEIRKAIPPGIDRVTNVYYDADNTTEIYEYRLRPHELEGVLIRLEAQMTGWSIIERRGRSTSLRRDFDRVLWVLRIIQLPDTERIVFGYREAPLNEGEAALRKLSSKLEESVGDSLQRHD